MREVETLSDTDVTITSFERVTLEGGFQSTSDYLHGLFHTQGAQAVLQTAVRLNHYAYLRVLSVGNGKLEPGQATRYLLAMGACSSACVGLLDIPISAETKANTRQVKGVEA